MEAEDERLEKGPRPVGRAKRADFILMNVRHDDT